MFILCSNLHCTSILIVLSIFYHCYSIINYVENFHFKLYFNYCYQWNIHKIIKSFCCFLVPRVKHQQINLILLIYLGVVLFLRNSPRNFFKLCRHAWSVPHMLCMPYFETDRIFNHFEVCHVHFVTTDYQQILP